MSTDKFYVLHTDPYNLGASLDIEEEALAEVGAKLTAIKCVTEDDVIEVGRDADAILCTQAPIRKKAIQALNKCRVIARYGVGIDTVDPDAATEKGIVVANVPDFCIGEVSNHTMMLLLACAKRLVRLEGWVRDGKWRKEPFAPMGSVHRQTLGLVACGNIARATASKAQAFHMEVLGYDPYIDPGLARASGIQLVGFRELLERSDYISLHTSLTSETHHIIGEKELQLMKPSAFLINTSRGPVVDEQALIKALKQGWIAGAGLDVLEKEPPDPNNPLLMMDNVVLTPHSASYSDNAFELLHHRVAEAAVSVLAGHWPLYVANQEVKKRVQLKEALPTKYPVPGS